MHRLHSKAILGIGRRWNSSQSANKEKLARVEAAKSYLQDWVGTKNTKKRDDTRIPSNPLLVSGTSYLLATLRLEKTDTPESIALKLDGYEREGAEGNREWKCPIVLDLRSWGPDGSPHYRPPEAGMLQRLVSILDNHGMAVVGLNGTPKELEEEASIGLGIPALWSSNRSMYGKCDLEDIVDLVARRRLECPITYEDEEIDEPEQDDELASSSIVEGSASELEDNSNPSLDPSNEIESDTASSTGEDVGSPNLEMETETFDNPLPSIQPSSTIYNGIVRSGQQVSSEKGQSLVILGSVSSGGEVMSDGDIIILGKLRGRALAGLSTSKARIIATSMDPELISIGGMLSTGDQMETISSSDGPIVVSINKDGQLRFASV